ncbi:hypothetical protein DKX38_002214 [Salix brachista]|uniref:Conserved oligomeric Golgi complex subunit 5 n=1 Tax=Salix brachista TaxID=2182728 RepID=A0A5N5NPC7_9ROSI|nr:hypothetical protein DKX38_002214 [Salix brachista]
MASPATTLQRSQLPSITATASPSHFSSSSPLQRLSTFKTPSSSSPAPPSSTTTNPSPSPLDSLSKDPILSPFLSPSFSSTSFSSAALSSGSPAFTAEHLHHAIRLLESQLRSDVLSRHSHLLHQLSSLKDAELSLSALRSAVSSLQSSVRRVRSDLSDHDSIQSKTIQLSNLHRTNQALQHTTRALRLSKKLRDVISASESEPEKLDLAKAAQLHCEVLTICDEFDLRGIDVVDEELNCVKETGEKLRSEAMKVLERGMEGLNQAEVGTGLQVLYNLRELKVTVEQLANKYMEIGVKSVGLTLDMKAISTSGGGGFGPGGIRGSGTPQIGGGAKAREALWQRMGNCMDRLHSIVVAVWHLQRVLSKKRDPFTHVLLLDEVIKDGDPMLTDRVWEALVKAFASQMKSAFTASSFVKEIFTMGYPKLFSLIENLLERISRDTDVKGVLPAITLEVKEQMVAAIEIFQTSFMALCLSRLTDLVNTVFPVSSRGSVPSKEQISRIVSRIQEEVEAVQLDGRLTLLVLREIDKVLLLLAERTEYQMSAGHEARRITGPATAEQVKNFALSQHLQEIHMRTSSMIAGLPFIAVDVLSPSLGAIYEVARDSVTPLFTAMIDRLESCILQIHDQNFGAYGIDAAMDNNASPYMEDLQRHASLVRPLSESGKLRMARDMAELELTIGQSLFPVEQLGPPYRALRAFRPLIFLETSQLGGSPLLQDLPPSVILHHLYTRGPDELESPLQRNRLTPLQYSLWLDSQGEDQIWKGIKATLDDYAAKIRSRGDKEFSPVYPLMHQLGSSLTENAAVSPKY